MEPVENEAGEPAFKRFNVAGTKSLYVSESYDTAEEAVAAASMLVKKGFALVSIRDTVQDEEW